MRLAGAIVLLGAAVYTGSVIVAVAIYNAGNSPKHANLADAFSANLGAQILIPGVILWLIGIMFLSGKTKEKE